MGTAARNVALLATLWGGAVAVNRSLRRVRGGSMEPTLAHGDLVMTVPWLRPVRGQVVVLRDPRDGASMQVKRVLGLPGEAIRSTRGRLLVDGVGLVEPYASGAGPDGALQVPLAHVAVLGDARGRSTDSRVYGAVPFELVEALVVGRVAPSPALLHVRPTSLGVARPQRPSTDDEPAVG